MVSCWFALSEIEAKKRSTRSANPVSLAIRRQVTQTARTCCFRIVSYSFRRKHRLREYAARISAESLRYDGGTRPFGKRLPKASRDTRASRQRLSPRDQARQLRGG